ncbi:MULTISPECIES: hypothetical protein [Streptomyces]|uniref:hypothetical protein n=1 Tax=Streptomyces TaxID=1883 RepID=UPI001E326A7A|nr:MULTISPECIES: hypothetical protein [Streptomyces]UFQ18493.1 hypothetical protein J2N69_27835 [Streptomyces huasconensis]WCL88106.1 hypothetical protein PPN52_27825 [Streptomyces sp. JCM 35825]
MPVLAATLVICAVLSLTDPGHQAAAVPLLASGLPLGLGIRATAPARGGLLIRRTVTWRPAYGRADTAYAPTRKELV